MPSKLAGRKLALLLVGAVLTILAAWVLSDASPSDTVRLPDGRRIKLRAITFGTNHHFSDKILHRILLPIVSTNIAAKLRLKEAVVPATSDSLVCWVELKSPRTALTSLEVAVADQDGRETVTQKTVAAGTLFGGRFITAHHFMSFPRRSRERFVKVYILEMAGKKKVAEFRVDNRMRSTAAGWIAEPLPVRRRGKDADFILSEFNTGLYSTTAFGEFSRTWTELVIDSVPSAAHGGRCGFV